MRFFISLPIDSAGRIVLALLAFGLACGLAWTLAGLWHFHVAPLY